MRAFQRDPLAFLAGCAAQFGPVVPIRLALWQTYLVTHPEWIKYVLVENGRNYTKQNIDYRLLKPVVGEGLLTSDDECWAAQRRQAEPALRDQMATLSEVTIELTMAMLERWHQTAARGQPVNAAQEMAHLSIEVVGRCLFGIDLRNDAHAIDSAFTRLNEQFGE